MIVAYSWHDFSYTLIKNSTIEYFDRFLSQLCDYTIDTVEHIIIACLLYIILCIIIYFLLNQRGEDLFNKPVPNAKRVLFVTAHPDDECMFFGPTIINFTKRQDCLVYLMCLSTGRNYGMGGTRRDELYKSCRVLGIEDCRISVHNHTNLPDAIDVRWPTEVISQLVLQHVESYDINTIITFDRHGVSRHSNHYSIYYAVANLIIDKRLPKRCSVYVLESVNILRKYWLIFDTPISFILSRIRYFVSHIERRQIITAMKQHKSQMLWFRYLYVYLSRYLLINTLQEMNLVDVELDLELDD